MSYQSPVLSVVIPAYNEADNIAAFHKQLRSALTKDKKLTYEIIYVNDGSSDGTLNELHKLAVTDKHLKIVSFSRNFGKEIATTAGINFATGEATILMDADGQHPPALIATFLQQWRQGAQVVIGVRRKNTKEGFINKYGSKLFYTIMNASADDVKLIPRSTDFRLIDQVVRQEFNRFTERQRLTRGLIDWVGYTKATVPFEAPERMGGQATYSFLKRAKLGMNSFVSLSLAPLHLLIYAGIMVTLCALAAAVFVFIEGLILDQLDFSGTFVLGIFILFVVGLLLTSQGLIALYISHIHSEAQNRPLYIIDRSKSVGL